MKSNWSSQLKRFANEGVAILNVITTFAHDVFANDASADNWVQLTPYGRFDNSQGMQEIRHEDAVACVENFKKMANAGTRIMGIPFYIGHPMHPSFSGKAGHSDTQAYGRVKSLEARPDGLFANVKWSTKGRELIANEAFHGHSVEWDMEKDTRQAIYRPVKVVSVGFTNNPNLPVRPITSANEKNMENLKAIAKSLGLPEDATETQIITAANEARTALASFTSINAALTTFGVKTVEELNEKLTLANQKVESTGTALATAQGSLTIANEKITELTNKNLTMTGELATVRINFANERKSRRTLVVDHLITTGRITGAEKTTVEATLANEGTFETEVDRMLKAEPKLKTNSVVHNLGQRNVQVANRQETIVRLVNERMEKTPWADYNAVWAQVCAENPAIVKQMESAAA